MEGLLLWVTHAVSVYVHHTSSHSIYHPAGLSNVSDKAYMHGRAFAAGELC
jgi:hypothetical protein